MKAGLLPLFFILLTFSLLPQESNKDDNKYDRISKVSVNDFYNFIAVNRIKMWVSNNGDGSHHPKTDGSGFLWPRQNYLPAIFEDGLLYGCRQEDSIKVNGNTHRQGLQAGKILPNGSADNPSLSKYRVYRIRKDWESLPPGPEREQLKRDYLEWPTEDGAPWVDRNYDGVFTNGLDQPEFIGDEVLWYVANDLDSNRTKFTYGSPPVGLEFQTTIWGHNSHGPLGDIVFKKYRIINKSGRPLQDMYLAYWSDPDLGNATDDYIGCDTILNMGYAYNGDNDDNGFYGISPPAVGYSILQGPLISSPGDSAFFDNIWLYGFKNMPLTSFINFIKQVSLGNIPTDPSVMDYKLGTLAFYNLMQGKSNLGSAITDPNTGEVVVKMVSGDPVTGTGWYEGSGWPGGPPAYDRRMLLTSGPFNMAPGDTQEIVYAIVIGKGANNILSINEIRQKAEIAKTILYSNNNPYTLPPSPVLHGVAGDKKITLWWEQNAEDFSAADPVLQDTIRTYIGSEFLTIPVTEKSFEFEGYRLWQYTDSKGSNPLLLGVFDKTNGVSSIKHYLYDYVIEIEPVKPVISGSDSGLVHFISLERDSLQRTELYNGNPYYFGITSYAYSKYSEIPALESKPGIIEVIPGRQGIDVQAPYSSGDYMDTKQKTGKSDAVVSMKVIDPEMLTGHEYSVVFTGPQNDIRYSLIDVSLNDTLIFNSSDFSAGPEHKEIIDGFILNVQNTGLDSSYLPQHLNSPRPVRSIQEVKGPGGALLEFPVDVITGLNSTGKWKIIPPSNPNYLSPSQNINWTGNIGADDYEIRFTAPSGGSEYYVTNYNPLILNTPLKNNYKGKGKVPFQVYLHKEGTDTTERMLIKVTDTYSRDTSWTKFGEEWEEFFAYTYPAGYSEPLPDTSGISTLQQHRIGKIVIRGDIPEPGTIVKITTWKPLKDGDVFTATATSPGRNNAAARDNIEKITVFPNPYYGDSRIERSSDQKFVRFTGLPQKAVVRIYSLAGVFIKKLEKDSPSEWLDWDLRNQHNLFVGSGIYLGYIDLPGIGTKVLKIAVIMEVH